MLTFCETFARENSTSAPHLALGVVDGGAAGHGGGVLQHVWYEHSAGRGELYKF